MANVPDCFSYIDTPAVSWINVDGLRKQDVESICSHFGIHNLIQEDILSLGSGGQNRRDQWNSFSACSICFISMRRIRPLSWSRLYRTGKNFVISFQEDPNRDVFNPLREKRKYTTQDPAKTAPIFFLRTHRHDRDNYFVVMEKLGERSRNSKKQSSEARIHEAWPRSTCCVRK